MPEENDQVAAGIEKFKNLNYLADMGGSKVGIKAFAPTLTNLSNALIVGAHGLAGYGFSPDPGATNQLAVTIRDRIEKGGDPLTLEEIASAMGSATNDIKRVIISACYAAGYNFPAIKKIFPNAEQLIAPDTDRPTSALYLSNVVHKRSEAFPYVAKDFSPFFSITPTATNLITRAPDWGAPSQVKVPLPKSKLDEVRRFGYMPPASRTNYSGKYTAPIPVFSRRVKEIAERYRQARANAKTKEDIATLDEDLKRAISEASTSP